MPNFDCSDMPTIDAFMGSDAFYRGLLGPFGSGKTSACSIDLAQRGVAQKPMQDGVRRSRWAVIRNYFRQLEDTTIKTFMHWFPPHQFGDYQVSKHRYVIRALRQQGDDRGAEIEIIFRALDRPDHVANLLSLELTGGWVNEGREVPWPIFDALGGRVGRYPPVSDNGGATWAGVTSDTNPPPVGSDWYKFFEEEDHTEKVAALAKFQPGLTVDGYRRIFKQPSGLSPQAENLRNLQPGYYQRLAIGKSDEWIKVYVHGQYGFVMEGKPVWPGYNDAIHCPDDLRLQPRVIPNLPIYRGWDFGLQPACVFTQLAPSGQWLIHDEVIGTRIGADSFSDAVLEHSSRNYAGFEFRDYGDPAGAQQAQTDERTCFQILHAKGIEIEPAIQTLAIRIESVAKPLRTIVDNGRMQFVLSKKCVKLRQGMQGGYHFRRLRVSGERYGADPDKNEWSHVGDALGYVGTRLFGVGMLMPRNTSLQWMSSDGTLNDRSRNRVTGY